MDRLPIRTLNKLANSTVKAIKGSSSSQTHVHCGTQRFILNNPDRGKICQSLIAEYQEQGWKIEPEPEKLDADIVISMEEEISPRPKQVARKRVKILVRLEIDPPIVSVNHWLEI